MYDHWPTRVLFLPGSQPSQRIAVHYGKTISSKLKPEGSKYKITNNVGDLHQVNSSGLESFYAAVNRHAFTHAHASEAHNYTASHVCLFLNKIKNFK